MVKKLLVFFVFISVIYADLLHDKIKELCDSKNYQIHQNLINLIFKDKSRFYINSERLNYQAIIEELKKNSLLSTKFVATQQFTITFKSNSNALFFLKTISSILNSVGYNQFITQNASYLNNQFACSVSLENDSIIDPEILLNEFDKRGCIVNNINKYSPTHWEYSVDSTNLKLAEAQFINIKEQLSLSKPISDYWIEIKAGTKLEIIPNISDSWFPMVTCYDKSLQIVKIEKIEEKTKKMVVELPFGTKYIKISDIYSLNNIKRGLTIKLY
ncbi:MAG: hypothetical protein HXX81_06365 [Campylobacterales bacterium]|nr:hypothetical protein [Campylobacterales bacterium]